MYTKNNHRRICGYKEQEVMEMGMKIQTGLRVPENQYERIKGKADRSGVSINQLILILVDIGLNYLDMELDEQNRFVFHNQKDTS